MIHPREQEILNILWKADKEMSSSDIVAAGHRLSQSTVQAVLRKLLKEGLVEAVGVTHSGNVLCRTFRPTEASRELILQQCIESYRAVEHIISIQQLMAALRKMEECDHNCTHWNSHMGCTWGCRKEEDPAEKPCKNK